METFWTTLVEFFSGERALDVVRAVIIVVIGLLLPRLVSAGLVTPDTSKKAPITLGEDLGLIRPSSEPEPISSTENA